jgi:hypothetical protein
MSIAMIVSPPSAMSLVSEGTEWSFEWCMLELRKRAYFYCFAVGTASHMLSILLGMAFCNALNEAARDSDVYRMFARGKGYVATVKSQLSFRVGVVADSIAMAVATTAYIHWAEVLIGSACLLFITLRSVRGTSKLLFDNASIVRYWRRELGGKPDADDPYDLQIHVECFKQRAQANKDLFMEGGMFKAEVSADPQSNVFQQVHRISAHMPAVAHSHGGHGQAKHAAAVAALF